MGRRGGGDGEERWRRREMGGEGEEVGGRGRGGEREGRGEESPLLARQRWGVVWWVAGQPTLVLISLCHCQLEGHELCEGVVPILLQGLPKHKGSLE